MLCRRRKYAVWSNRRRGAGEEFVDDKLHGQINQALLDYNAPQTLVLVTGSYAACIATIAPVVF